MQTSLSEQLGHLALGLRGNTARELECFAEVLEEIADEAYERHGNELGSDHELSVACAMARRLYAAHGDPCVVYDG